MQLAITCALGLESVVRKEIERLGFPVSSVADRLVRHHTKAQLACIRP